MVGGSFDLQQLVLGYFPLGQKMPIFLKKTLFLIKNARVLEIFDSKFSNNHVVVIKFGGHLKSNSNFWISIFLENLVKSSTFPSLHMVCCIRSSQNVVVLI